MLLLWLTVFAHSKGQQRLHIFHLWYESLHNSSIGIDSCAECDAGASTHSFLVDITNILPPHTYAAVRLAWTNILLPHEYLLPPHTGPTSVPAGLPRVRGSVSTVALACNIASHSSYNKPRWLASVLSEVTDRGLQDGLLWRLGRAAWC